jgi:hypothetical protein
VDNQRTATEAAATAAINQIFSLLIASPFENSQNFAPRSFIGAFLKAPLTGTPLLFQNVRPNQLTGHKTADNDQSRVQKRFRVHLLAPLSCSITAWSRILSILTSRLSVASTFCKMIPV